MRAYLDLLETILTKGRMRTTPRNGASTLAVFGEQLRFNLTDGFPIVTTRKVALRPAIEEVLWFLSGSTNNEELKAKNISIWDSWAAPSDVPMETRLTVSARREHYYQQLLSAGLAPTLARSAAILANEKKLDDEGVVVSEYNHHPTRKGELGPIYGQMWRAWPNADGTTTDQIQTLLDNLRTRPYSRRHVISAWNPSVLPSEEYSPIENVYMGKQCLPPCHTTVQFSVEPMTHEERIAWFDDHTSRLNTKPLKLALTGDPVNLDIVLTNLGVPKDRLSCKLFARSQDVPVGTVFNIIGYAFLTTAIAHALHMVPGEYIHSCGDAHIYSDQIDLVKAQLKRQPKKLPFLRFEKPIDSIFDITYDDVTLEGYQAHPSIKYPVTV